MDAVAVLAAALDLVHRAVGVFQPFGQRLAVPGVQADADARAQQVLAPLDHQRLGEGLEQLARDVVGTFLAFQLRADGNELVAADARADVGAARGRAQPRGHLFEHLVANAVAGAIVDRLEVVDINEHHRHLLVWAVGKDQRVFEQRAHVTLVAQAGKRVLERQVQRA